MLTSSIAAITGFFEPGRVYNEDDWNEESSVEEDPLFYAKAETERQSVKFVEKKSLELVRINPFFMLGPPLSSRKNESIQLIAMYMRGDYPSIIPMGLGIV